MTEWNDTRLASGSRASATDENVTLALEALVTQRAAEARPRRRKLLLPALSIGITVGLLGAGAVAASQWEAWTYVTEPDLVITRDWTDVAGNGIGTCESHFATHRLSGDDLAAAQSFLTGLDVDAIEPDPEDVAGQLVAVGREGELGNLIAGARASDFDITHTGPLWKDMSNARILQNGLTQKIFVLMGDELFVTRPELRDTLRSNIETQCTTDVIAPGE